MSCPVVLEDDEVGEYLVGLMELLLRASTGPFTVQTTSRRRHTVVIAPANVQPVASFTRPVDAELFVRSAMGLQNVVQAFAEIRRYHYDDGTGHCAECQKSFPCGTRRAVLRVAGAGGAVE